MIPAILQCLDTAKRMKYMRCLTDYKNEEYWRKLWLQSKNSGKILVRKGVEWLGEAGKHLDDLSNELSERWRP